MVKLTQFELPFSEDFTIKGEYEGNEKSGKIIIFSHGFGNMRDSQGLFNQISHVLLSEFLTIKFDYNQCNPKQNSVFVPPPSHQQKILQQIIGFALDTFSPLSITILAHSLGSVIASKSNLHSISSCILLAPPIASPYPHMQERYSRNKDSKFDPDGESKILRSDGTWTVIQRDFWQEIKKIQPAQDYKKAAQTVPTTIIQAADDHVLVNEDYSSIENIENLTLIKLSGDHSFSPPHRQKLLDTIQQILLEAP